ncbi:serine protease [Actinoplanes sp. N902-109]|uniref:trypsin-like serine peptidase n=1 Tax=Actinoplanes sp. (strain N902-109) TaxID=649831 RepID=UPI0003293F4B|nr:hypothetical protein [Actinoplanes sp. N902-109]AGL20104.1 hypothetical protein L083_6594 [Actinoplanes sp. N902-109]
MRILIPLAAIALIVGAAPTAAQAVPASPGGTAVNRQSAAVTAGYWTPSRLAAAKPVPQPLAPTTEATAATEPTGTPRFVHATEPAGVHTMASEWITNGRLFFTNPGVGDFVCSANVVSSNNHDVIATARHCVADPAAGKVYQNFRFAPAYNKGNAPYGWWTWRSAGWRIDDTGPGGDNAFLVLNRGGNANAHVQDVVGGSGIGFNWATNSYAHAIGLPASVDYAVWCEGQPYDGPSGGVQIRTCNGLSGGASGGSFIVNYQSDGSAVQTASYFGSWGDAYWAYYRDAAWQVYNGASNA